MPQNFGKKIICWTPPFLDLKSKMAKIIGFLLCFSLMTPITQSRLSLSKMSYENRALRCFPLGALSVLNSWPLRISQPSKLDVIGDFCIGLSGAFKKNCDSLRASWNKTFGDGFDVTWTGKLSSDESIQQFLAGVQHIIEYDQRQELKPPNGFEGPYYEAYLSEFATINEQLAFDSLEKAAEAARNGWSLGILKEEVGGITFDGSSGKFSLRSGNIPKLSNNSFDFSYVVATKELVKDVGNLPGFETVFQLLFLRTLFVSHTIIPFKNILFSSIGDTISTLVVLLLITRI